MESTQSKSLAGAPYGGSLLTSGMMARIFGIGTTTVFRCADEIARVGVRVTTTSGGHLRFAKPDVIEHIWKMGTTYASDRVEVEQLINELLSDKETLLMPVGVARMFRVDPKTVARWAQNGQVAKKGIRVIRTFGHHCRFVESDVTALIRTEAGSRYK